MEKKPRINPNLLLPNIFKKIGLVIAVASLTTAVAAHTSNTTFSAHQKEIFKVSSLALFILGLIFVSWSKDKREEEINIALRYKSMTAAFFFVVQVAVLGFVFDLFIKEPVQFPEGISIIIQVLLIFLVIYESKKQVHKEKMKLETNAKKSQQSSVLSQ